MFDHALQCCFITYIPHFQSFRLQCTVHMHICKCTNALYTRSSAYYTYIHVQMYMKFYFCSEYGNFEGNLKQYKK